MLQTILAVISAFLCVSLALYSVVRQRTIAAGTFSFVLLLLAAMEVLDRFSMYPSFDAFTFKRAAMFAESLIPSAFLFFSTVYARPGKVKSVPLLIGIIASSVLFPACIFYSSADSLFYGPDLKAEGILFLGNAGYWFYIGIMLSLVIALMNLEATFSSASGSFRWQIKFEVIGIISILAVLIFYYSQGLLYRTMNMNLLPVRSGVLIIGSCLITYSKLLRGNPAKPTVSRYIFYRSLTLLFVGLYLLILGIIGEGMKYLDINLSRDLAIFAAFAIGIIMVAVFLSEQLRRKVKVFVNKNFYPHKHDYRNEWLNFAEGLAACRSFPDVQEAILTKYRVTFGLKRVSLYLLDRDKGSYLLAANQAMPGDGLRLQASAGLIFYLKERELLCSVSGGEYATSEEEADFIGRSGARAIVPLTANGEVEGFVVFGEQLVKEEFTYEDYDLMKTIAKQAALSIINFRLSEELGATREIAAVGRISSFVMHDLKNLASNLSLTLDNAEQFMHDPEFQTDMITTTRNTLSKMKDLIQRLRTFPHKSELKKGPVEMYLLTEEVVDEVRRAKPDLTFEYRGSSAMAFVDGEEIRKVILNLLLNAVDALGKDGAITIEIGAKENWTYIAVGDNGSGMTKEFIADRLFRPFQTTKKKGLGIGLYQCKQIMAAHGGTIEVESEAGRGSVFTVRLPSLGRGSASTAQ